MPGAEPSPGPTGTSRLAPPDSPPYPISFVKICINKGTVVSTSAGDPRRFGADLYLCLMDPDPTPVFSDFKDATNFFSS